MRRSKVVKRRTGAILKEGYLKNDHTLNVAHHYQKNISL